MFFTRIGTVMAYIGFFMGVLKVSMGFFIATFADDMASNQAMAWQYFAARNSGEVINEGFHAILVSVALGVICEISRRVRGTQP